MMSVVSNRDEWTERLRVTPFLFSSSAILLFEKESLCNRQRVTYLFSLSLFSRRGLQDEGDERRCSASGEMQT